MKRLRIKAEAAGGAWSEAGARTASDHLPVVADLDHIPMAA